MRNKAVATRIAELEEQRDNAYVTIAELENITIRKLQAHIDAAVEELKYACNSTDCKRVLKILTRDEPQESVDPRKICKHCGSKRMVPKSLLAGAAYGNPGTVCMDAWSAYSPHALWKGSKAMKKNEAVAIANHLFRANKMRPVVSGDSTERDCVADQILFAGVQLDSEYGRFPSDDDCHCDLCVAFEKEIKS